MRIAKIEEQGVRELLLVYRGIGSGGDEGARCGSSNQAIAVAPIVQWRRIERCPYQAKPVFLRVIGNSGVGTADEAIAFVHQMGEGRRIKRLVSAGCRLAG